MIILGNILAILQIITAIIITFLVLLQSDNESGNIVAGNSNNSNMGMSKNAKLAKVTAWVGVIFVILTIASSTVMLINVK